MLWRIGRPRSLFVSADIRSRHAVTSPSVSAVAHWYQKKRGTMMGVVGAGAASGSVVLPIALNKLITVVGFPWVRSAFDGDKTVLTGSPGYSYHWVHLLSLHACRDCSR